MTASLSGLFPFQVVDSTGKPIMAARVYTYAAGTTTQKTAYTDAAASIPHTYTSDGLGGQYIAANARGELPAPLFFLTGAYDVAVKDASGAGIWTRRAVPVDDTGVPFTTFAASLAASSGSSLVGFIQAGAGAVLRTQQAKSRDAVNVADYGAPLTGAADDGAALNRAIVYVYYTLGSGVVEFPAGCAALINTKVLIPSGVFIKLKGARITGGGIGYATPMFETAYDNAGTLTTNIGTASNTHSVLNCGVIGEGATITNAGIVLNTQDTHDTCAFGGFSTLNCTQTVKAVYPYYASFSKITSRGSATASASPAFQFSSFNNVIRLQELFVNGRALAYQFDSGCFGLTISGCSAESCTAGFKFTDTVQALAISGCYFENVTGNAIEFSGGGSSFTGVKIDGNWFNLCGKAVQAINFTGTWGLNNILNTGTNTVDFSASTCKARVEIPVLFSPDNNATPALPSNYTLGTGCEVVRTNVVYNSGTGAVIVKAADPGANVIPLPYYGDTGDLVAGTAIFGTISSTNGGGLPNIQVIVDTNIAYRTQTMLVAYNFTITDNVSTYICYGMVFGGTNVKVSDATGKTVVASNQAGKLRLTLSTFSHPTGLFTCTGLARHL